MSEDDAVAPTAPANKLFGMPIWLIVVLAVLVLGGIGAVVKANKKDSTPSHPVELCDTLRDPSNAILDASDYRRLSGFTESQLMTYVTERCPDQLDKVR